MRVFGAVIGAALLAAVPPAEARDLYGVDIPAGTLKHSAAQLAAQAGANIVIADTGLGRLPVPRVAGRVTPEEALRRMTRGLPVKILVIDASSFRIVRAAAVRRSLPSAARLPARRRAAPPPPQTIVVTASKRGARASDYTGPMFVIPAEALGFSGAAGTDAIERVATSLSSTHLGQGRDKLFLRGVADSSFSGHTQGTVGQYLGEARLNYSGPDPDLRLYDVARVEILPGPQGSLYGAGSLGGVIRVEPNTPDPSQFDAEGILSLSLPGSGDPGGEAAAVLNLPVRSLPGAVRLVGYRLREGGYIDDAGRGVPDSNGLSISGARAALALEPSAGWRAELLGAFQKIDGQDATYADRRLPTFTRAASIVQPYKTRFRLASLTLERSGGGIGMTANLAYSLSGLRDRFDARETLPDTFFLARKDGSRVVTAEARLHHTGATDFGWMAGTAFVDSRTSFASALHYQDGSELSASAHTATREFVLFGEATRKWGAAVLTVGGRAAHWQSRSRTSTRDGPPALLGAAGKGWRFLPSVSVLVPLGGDLQLLARRASSYRPPTAAASPGGVAILSGDRYGAWEIAVRLPRSDSDSISGAVSLSWGRWDDVQADIIDNSGFLSATNIGNARTLSLETSMGWKLSNCVQLDAGVSFNRTRLWADRPGIINFGKSRLPNVPDVNAQFSIIYSSPSGSSLPLRVAARLRYNGRSVLGVGPDLGRRQGGFADLAADMTLRDADREWFVGVANLLGTARSRFALGSIAQAGSEDLFVPQRPRTIRIGVRLGRARPSPAP